jgi:hypothetical protein
MKMLELFGPRPDNESIETINGCFSWRDYLDMEKKRISKNPNRIVKVVNRLGFSWLLVNDVTTSNKKAPSSRWGNLMPAGQKKVRS